MGMVVLAILPTGESASMMSPTLTSVGCARDVVRRQAAKPIRKSRKRAFPAIRRGDQSSQSITWRESYLGVYKGSSLHATRMLNCR
jgi:hypothetical protein